MAVRRNIGESSQDRHGIDSAMFSVVAEFRRRRSPCTNVPIREKQGRHLCMIYDQHPFQNGFPVSWGSTDDYYEPWTIFQLEIAACNLSWYCILDPDVDGSEKVLSDQHFDSVDSMDLSILETLYTMIQGWDMFFGIRIGSPTGPLPLQLSVPVYYWFSPAVRYPNLAKTERLLAARPERILEISCLAKWGTSSSKATKQQLAPISPVMTYRLSVATTDLLMKWKAVDGEVLCEAMFSGSAAERLDCLQKVMDELWEDAEHQLTAWEQLYLRACVKTCFVHFWKEPADDSNSESE
jgi:hypothetical protein